VNAAGPEPVHLQAVEPSEVAASLDASLLNDGPPIAPLPAPAALGAIWAAADQLIVRADREKVRQIVVNLVSNACKFTPRHGAIDVDCVRLDDAIEIRVTDTGPGIPPQKLDAIFEPFVQLDNGLTRASAGTGLGLSISRELARAMGGDLAVTSVYGQGSTFTLTLPRGDVESELIPQPVRKQTASLWGMS